MKSYGKKGGTGATAGRKAITYQGTAPDGTILRKRSFFISEETALMGVLPSGGGNGWIAVGIVLTEQDWGDTQFIPARRIR